MADHGLVDRAVDDDHDHGVHGNRHGLGGQALKQVAPEKNMEGSGVALHDDAVEGASHKAEDKAAENTRHNDGEGHLPGVPCLRQAAAENIRRFPAFDGAE